MGSLDWSGLPYVVELLGLHDDIEALLHRFEVIRARPKPDADLSAPEQTE